MGEFNQIRDKYLNINFAPRKAFRCIVIYVVKSGMAFLMKIIITIESYSSKFYYINIEAIINFCY